MLAHAAACMACRCLLWHTSAALQTDISARLCADTAHRLHRLVLSAAGGVLLQAAQVRKSNYVPERGLDYDPETNSTSTVYAGTTVQQV